MGNFDKILRAKGKALDIVETLADELLKEYFPDTTRDNTAVDVPTADASAYGLLEYWEAKHQIIPSVGATLEERRQILLAHEVAIGGLSLSYFEGIIESFGYSIGTHAEVGDPHARITEGDFPPFRAGFSVVGSSAVWDQNAGHSYHTSCIRGTSVESDTALQELIVKYWKANKEIIFINE